MTTKSEIQFLNQALSSEKSKLEAFMNHEPLPKKQTEVVVKRFMTEITTYPNGQDYIRTWLVSKGTKAPKKTIVKKEAQETEVSEEETY